MSLKLASLDLLKTNLFWNKECDVLISVYDVTNKVQSRDSTYIMDVIMWLTFDNCTTFMIEVIMTSIL